MSAVVIVLAVIGAVAVVLVASLLVAVPLGRHLRRVRRSTTTPLRRTDRGTTVGLLALGVLVAIVLAVATRGQVVTWDGVLTVGVPA